MEASYTTLSNKAKTETLCIPFSSVLRVGKLSERAGFFARLLEPKIGGWMDEKERQRYHLTDLIATCGVDGQLHRTKPPLRQVSYVLHRNA